MCHYRWYFTWAVTLGCFLTVRLTNSVSYKVTRTTSHAQQWVEIRDGWSLRTVAVMLWWQSGTLIQREQLLLDQQQTLDGLSNPLSIASFSQTNIDWLGLNFSSLVIGDALMFRCSIPVRSIFDGFGGGCQAVAMSTDAKYVAVISTGASQVV